MKYIDNMKNLDVSEETLDTWKKLILENEGLHRPRDGGKPQGPEGEKEWQKAIDAGYDPTATYFQMFDKNNCPFELPEFHRCGRSRHWWLTKMMPGDFMPMHVDPHTTVQKNAQRFWIPLQDWEIGHIFKFENEIVTNYKKGDIYEYDDAQGLHGAANIGLTPRVVLQVTLYEEEQ
jgi:hypothetical protein